MPRRIYTYAPGWDGLWNMVVTIGLVRVRVRLPALPRQRVAEPAQARPRRNPWGAGTLEWSVSSPPPPYNFACIPRVGSRHPLWEAESASGGTVLDEGPPLDDGHQAVSTTALDARTDGDPADAGDSLWPFYLSVATLFLFYALLFDRWVVAVLAAVATVVCLVGWLWPGARAVQPRNA